MTEPTPTRFDASSPTTTPGRVGVSSVVSDKSVADEDEKTNQGADRTEFGSMHMFRNSVGVAGDVAAARTTLVEPLVSSVDAFPVVGDLSPLNRSQTPPRSSNATPSLPPSPPESSDTVPLTSSTVEKKPWSMPSGRYFKAVRDFFSTTK